MKRLFIVFLLAISFSAFSQKIKSPAPIVIPPSPTVSSLGKFVDFPVSMYTGVPNINIPIYELKGHAISVPISLSYQGGGVKVEDVPSWVGLGWTLNAGGVITRSVRGIADETTNGGYFGESGKPQATNLDWYDVDHYEWLEDLAYGTKELTPDLFVFNFNGYTGKFYFDLQHNIHLVSQQDIKIINPDILTLGQSSIWTIITPDGTEYSFGGVGATEQTITSIYADGGDYDFTSAWYLTKIETVFGEEVNFDYELKDITYDLKYAETDYIGAPGAPAINPQPARSQQGIIGVDLYQISTSDQVVTFVRDASSTRDDLKTGGHRLKEIQIKSSQLGSIFKQFVLTTDYSISGRTSPDPYLQKRLMLRGMKEYGADINGDFKEHKFYYNEGGNHELPPRDSNAQDHWGYFNGKHNNSTLLPAYAGMPAGTPFGDRSPNGSHMAAGMLYKIEYPTKGFTKFNYETQGYNVTGYWAYPGGPDMFTEIKPATIGDELASDDFVINHDQTATVMTIIEFHGDLYGEPGTGAYVNVYDASNDELIASYTEEGRVVEHDLELSEGSYYLKITNTDHDNVEISARISYTEKTWSTGTKVYTKGGIRIESMQQNDGNGDTPNITKSYKYFDHKVFTDINNDSYIGSYHSSDLASGACGEGQSEMHNYHVRTSSSKSAMGSIQGSSVGYGRVRIYTDEHGSQGYSEYEYTLDVDIGGGIFPYPPILNREHRRGLLLSQKDYNSAGDLLKKQINNYEIISLDSLTGIVAGFFKDDHCFPGVSGRIYDVLNYSSFTSAVSEWVRKDSTIDIAYGPNGEELVQVTKNHYQADPLTSHVQPIGQTVTNSKGETITTSYKFAADYDVASGVIYDMQQKHAINIINPLIETTQWLNQGAQSFLISGQKTTYKNWGASGSAQFKPQYIHGVELDVPLLSSVFDADPDAYYKSKLTYDLYDDYGQIRQYTLADQNPITFIWGYKERYPVAKIENKTYAEVSTALGTDLTLIQVNNLSDSQTNTILENLRTTFTDAIVSGSTYDLNTGNTSSQIDPNGQRTYYKYDGLDRLIRILDDDEHIVKTYNYHYRESN